MTGKTRKDTSVGVIIKKRLSEIERSQGWLARKTGYTPNYVNFIIRGRFSPSQTMLEKIAAVLEIDVDTLIAALDERQ